MYTTPNINIASSKTNCITFGIMIFFKASFVPEDSSKYFTACSNDFVKDPDSSPTLIMLTYIYGNMFE